MTDLKKRSAAECVLCATGAKVKQIAGVWLHPDPNGGLPLKCEARRIRLPQSGMTQAAQDVLAERCRQIESEGWTPEHDDGHDDGSMAMAAVCYATPEPLFRKDKRANATIYVDPWPWGDQWDKRKSGNVVADPAERSDAEYRRDLVKAGALILAEIERLDRAAAEDPAND